MKLIIPMAGRGTRVRPHSHVTPKPLLEVRGSNMVERIVDTLSRVLPRRLEEAMYIIGPDFGNDVREQLTDLSRERDVKAHFAVQEVARGSAHAVLCAGDFLEGEGIIVYADTLFDMEQGIKLDGADVIAWVKHVEDPRRFGVAIRKGDRVIALEEKPQNPVSNEALIGIYYIKDLRRLKREIETTIELGEKGPGGEYFLTGALDRMLQDGAVFKTASVTEWLDCGTIPALLQTTRYILEKEKNHHGQGHVQNSVLIEPVYIGPGARIIDSVVGPFVSVEGDARIYRSVVSDSILFAGARVENAVLSDSIIGQHALVRYDTQRINVGDDSEIGGR